jgi:dTDP-4-dehydrorhamnose reductase
MRIGLTGARGVLGTRIRSALSSKGHEVVPYDGDVRDFAAIDAWANGLEAAVHAAAIVPIDKVVDQLFNAISVNVAGTANVARAIARNSNCHLTYISTSHVYTSSDRPLKENETLKPVSLYGLTKLQGEQWISSLLNRTLIVRVFSFFDARQPEPYLIPSLRARIFAAYPGQSIRLAGALNVRDIADAQWLAEVCARLIETNQVGTVNCGTGVGHTVIKIAQKMTGALGRTDVGWEFDASAPANMLTANIGELIDRIGPLPAFELDDALNHYVHALG